MARRLPWAATGSSEAAKPKARRVASTAVGKEVKNDVAQPETPEYTPRKSRRTRASPRSPSTSPIRPPVQPISQVEKMRPGLAQDDIYMMVEDEFESVARTFTAHLHAAEYARLKAKAKSLPPRTLPSPSSGMSRTTAHGLERKQLLSRQETALNGLKSRSHEEDEDEEEDKVIENPWSGTSLATLMDEGERNKTSLVGLERLQTGTRAARGFNRGNSFVEDPAARKRIVKDTFDIDDVGSELFGTAVNDVSKDDKVRHSEKRREQLVDQASTSTSTRRPPDSPAHNTNHKRIPGSSLLKPPLSSTSKSPSTSSKPPPPQRRSRIIDLDEFDDEPIPDRVPISVSVSVSEPGTQRTAVKIHAENSKDNDKDKDKDREKQQGRKRRLDEVPVFLM